MNEVVLLGSNGMLGTYINSFFRKKYTINLTCIDRKKFEVINNLSNLELLFNNFKENTVVINCIGLIPQAIRNNCFTNYEKNYYTINSIFPIILATICEKKNFKLIHITTDCVFLGKKGNYIETDYHDAITSYGISKSLAENMLIINKVTIIRTSIIGEELYNKYSLLEWIKNNNNKEINGYNNHYWNGITCLELAKILYKIIDENLYWNGVRHIYSNEKVSKYELINMIKDIYNLNITVNCIDDTTYCDRSLNSLYNDIKTKSLLEQLKELKDYSIL